MTPNPALPEQCELDLAISLDLSNSVADGQLTQMRTAIGDMAAALTDYPVRIAVHNFASNAPATSARTNAVLPLTSVAGVGAQRIANHVADIARPASAQGGTNWDRALAVVAGTRQAYDALLFVTDGNPTQYGSPAAGPGNSTNQAVIDAAVHSANTLKAKGTRVIGMGVTDNLTPVQERDFIEHMGQISGPVAGSDYYDADFATLRDGIVGIVDSSCSSISLEKAATIDADGAVGYSFVVTNTGGVELTDVSLSDPLAGLSEVTFGEWPVRAGVLAPGESVTAMASYEPTDADYVAGGVDNTATATGETPAGNTVEDTDSAAVPLQPAISLVKEAALADDAEGVVGDTVSYSFTATNEGPLTLTDVEIADELDGLYGLTYGTWPGESGVLAPGQSVSATASYDLTQADVDAGRVDNTATVTGNPPAGPAVTDDDAATVETVAGVATIELVKTGALADGALGAAGDLVTYSFVATNTGNVTLTGVTVADPLPGLSGLSYDWSAASTEGVLAPNESVRATATYSVTQADVDAGHVDNTATTTGTPPLGDPVSDTDGATVTVPGTPDITVVKAGELPEDAEGVVGDTVTYRIVATNTGTVTLTGVTVVDELEGLSDLSHTWPGEAGVLAPGEHVTATATYDLTQGDVDAGKVENIARATGTPPTGDPVEDEDPVTVIVPGNPGIVVDKDGSLPTGQQHRAGDVITYSFTATNSGNVTLSDVAIVDGKEGLSELTYTWPGVAGVLAPNQSVTATATYALTQADIDSGEVTNSATATGTPPSGDPVEDEHPHDITVAQVPAITVVKDGALPADAGAGDTVSYSFTATNSGNTTLSDVTIDDAKEGLYDFSYGEWPGEAGVLAPGQSVTATASYDLTQADVDAGRVDNTATAVGTSPQDVGVDDEDHHTVVVERTPGISLVKAGVLAEGAQGAPGETVTYSFTATNDGNVTLSGVEILDEKDGLSELVLGEWPGEVGVLAPGESVTATATYGLTQADVDAGTVENTATVTGDSPGGEGVSDEDPATVPVPQAPGITVVKTGELPEGAEGVPGEVVDYTLTATNTGNLTLTGVEILDAKEGLSELVYGEWPGEAGVLAPGESVSATASYTLTQGDVDAGTVANTATATGTTPSGGGVEDEDPHNVVVPGNPGIALVKDGVLVEGAQGAPGEVVTYSFTATNTGNVTLSGVEILDAKEGLSELAHGQWPGAEGVLAPGESVSATATYVLTQGDIDAGTVLNSATATGTTPSGEDVSDEDPATVPVPQVPGITVAKSGGLAEGATGVPGEVVDYTLTATNTGNVTLTGVEILDAKEGLSELVHGEWPGEAGVLAPGESVSATASYTLTQGDVDTGTVANTGSATGTTPGGGDVTDEDPHDVPVPQRPSISVVKDGVLVEGAQGVPGETVTYTLTATNDGNVTLSGVEILDAKEGLSELAYGEWPGAEGVLAPGESVTATATYDLTQADVDAGTVENTATVTGDSPGGEGVSDEDPATVPVPQAPGIAVVKTGSLPEGAEGVPGEVVEYTLTATNTGNLTLTGVEIVDAKEGLSELGYGEWPGEAGVLAPGESVSATASYMLTQADVDAGTVANTGTATGTTPGGADVTDEDPHDVVVPGNPGIALDKDGVLQDGAQGAPGEVVTYSFTATNTGNVTLDGVVVDDAMAGLSEVSYGQWPGDAGVLAPGESVSATATYTLTQADVDAGEVLNRATATGTTPTGEDVTDEDPARVTVPQLADVTVVKDGSLGDKPHAVGDTVSYTMTATNTGNVTLTGVEILDDKEGLYDFAYGEWPGVEGVLAPGESVTATASYDLTAADIEALEVRNAATVVGTPPSGPEVTDDDESVVAIERFELSPEVPAVAEPNLPTTGAAVAPWALLVVALLLGGAALRTRVRSS